MRDTIPSRRPTAIPARCAGFTLIEFIVAAALMSLMGVLLFGSLRVAMKSYTISQTRLEEEGRRRVLEDMVRRQLGSLFPFTPAPLAPGQVSQLGGSQGLGGQQGLGTQQTLGGPQGVGRQQGLLGGQQPLLAGVPLFYGSAEAMTFVTVAPFDVLGNPGLTVVRYGHAEDELGHLYFGAMESRYTGPLSFEEMVAVPSGKPIPVIKEVEELSFEYYAVEELSGIGEWYEEWSTLDTGTVPSAIRIRADEREIVVAINTQSQVATAAPANLGRILGSGYRPQ